ncbi:MAG: transposase family protein, partial [Deltaproteobacteria bacterium]|nr:transposase family protein [Deltaproteobacteria bacterium]
NFEKVKTRLLRYVVVDHFSGAFFFRYYDTTGETQDNLYEFLKEAWGKKADAKMPFRGVPFNLLMDSGAANKSRAIVAMLERLGVNIPKGRPYNPQRQGAVETMHETLEAWFESGLRIQPAFDVVTLNAWADDWSIRFQAAKAHTRTGMPRTQCWLMIQPSELRELPSEELMQDFFANPEEDCPVYGDYSIRFRGKVFGVKHVEGIAPRTKVKAILKPFKWLDEKIVVAHNGAVYECSSIETLPASLGGFRADAAVIGANYKAQPETLTQQAKKRFENMAYGEEKKKGAVPFEGLRVFGHHADAVEGLAFMPREGTPFETDRPAAPARISITQFFKELKNAIGVIPAKLNEELRARYGETIDRKEAEEEIRRQRDGAGEKTQELKEATA